MRPLFLGQQELSNLDYYFQNGGKTGAQTNQSFWKLNNIFWWSKISQIIIKGWNFMIKSFSGQVFFCFAILRAISAYVCENWLSQYSLIKDINLIDSCQAHLPVQYASTSNSFARSNTGVVIQSEIRRKESKQTNSFYQFFMKAILVLLQKKNELWRGRSIFTRLMHTHFFCTLGTFLNCSSIKSASHKSCISLGSASHC